MIHHPFSKLIMPATALLVALSPPSSWSAAKGDEALSEIATNLAALNTESDSEREHALAKLKDWQTRLSAGESGTLDVIAPEMVEELARLKKRTAEEDFDTKEWAQGLMSGWTDKLKVGKEGSDGVLKSALAPEDFGRLHGQVMQDFRRTYLGLADEADKAEADY